MCKVQLKDLKVGDNVAVFGAYDKKKYTVEHVELRVTQNGKEFVSIAMKSEDGEHTRVSPFMPSDREVTLWTEDDRQKSIEKELKDITKSVDEVADRFIDSDFHEHLLQALKGVMRAIERLKENK